VQRTGPNAHSPGGVGRREPSTAKARGNVAPLRILSGPSKGLNAPVFVAITTAGALAPPTIAKAFGAASIALSGSTDLTFTIANHNGSTLTGVGFTDSLPAGLVISTPNGLAGSCGGGAMTAVPGSGSAILASATLGSSASCSFSVSVTGATGNEEQYDRRSDVGRGRDGRHGGGEPRGRIGCNHADRYPDLASVGGLVARAHPGRRSRAAPAPEIEGNP